MHPERIGTPRTRLLGVPPLLTALLVATTLTASATAGAQTRKVPDRFTATTTAMTPSGITLRFDVLEWSDEAARAAVVQQLAGEGGGANLTELPTLGYVWPSDSPVGYSIKYAVRTAESDGLESVTFVTDKQLGSYEFKPWSVEGDAGADAEAVADAGAGADTDADAAEQYSVIVLRLDEEGNGGGSLSLGAEVVIDRGSSTVSLEDGGTPLLTGARREPKPYWAEAETPPGGS